MNCILLHSTDFIAQSHVAVLTDYRFEHCRTILKAVPGDSLEVGIINGKRGTALVKHITPNTVTLHVTCNREPPSKSMCTLVCALPRPKMLKRILRTASELGIAEIIFLNTWKVEKSFWKSSVLHHPEQYCIAGLEQAGDTVLPRISFQRRFKPFVEDILPGIVRKTTTVVFDPHQNEPSPMVFTEPTTIVFGPEGGFIPWELKKFAEAGCRFYSLGERVYRLETVIPFIIGRIV